VGIITIIDTGGPLKLSIKCYYFVIWIILV